MEEAGGKCCDAEKLNAAGALASLEPGAALTGMAEVQRGKREVRAGRCRKAKVEHRTSNTERRKRRRLKVGGWSLVSEEEAVEDDDGQGLE